MKTKEAGATKPDSNDKTSLAWPELFKLGYVDLVRDVMDLDYASMDYWFTEQSFSPPQPQDGDEEPEDSEDQNDQDDQAQQPQSQGDEEDESESESDEESAEEDEDSEGDDDGDTSEPDDSEGDDEPVQGDEREPDGVPDAGEEDSEDENESDGGQQYSITDPEETGETLIPGFWQDGNVYRREFASWFDFVKCVANDSLRVWKDIKGHNMSRSREDHHNKDWSGTDTFEEAIDMALRTGWPEGRKLLYDCIVAVSPRTKTFENLEFDVAGSFPCVPMYLAGDPACMVLDPGLTTRSQKPIVRIDYNSWVSCNVSVKDQMLRGAAVVSLMESLEQRGLSVELRITGASKNRSWDADKKTFRMSVVYKKAGEHLDLDRAAFAIAHPAAFRRLSVALLEQHADLEATFNTNYGHPTYDSNDPNPDTIFIPGSKGHETPESARKAIEDAAAALFAELDEAAE